jgi:ADP-ribose pyrophosphatase YjhB (NUDIX family)
LPVSVPGWLSGAVAIEYCRKCGAETARRIPPGDDRPRATCVRCGVVEYDNPKVVVACALYEGDRMLWVRRTMPPYAGCWALPAGFVELGETVEEAACREVLEETHLQVAPDELVFYAVLSLPDVEQIYIALAAALPGHEYGPSAEASEVLMIGREEISSYQLGYPDATVELVLGLYDVIARGEIDRARDRVFKIRGTDPAAHLPGSP